MPRPSPIPDAVPYVSPIGLKPDLTSQQIRLFRGDMQAVEVFDIDKTKAECLVGRGIYLTSCERIADTYRLKGTSRDRSHLRHQFLTCDASSRAQAVEKAFVAFMRLDPTGRWNIGSHKWKVNPPLILKYEYEKGSMTAAERIEISHLRVRFMGMLKKGKIRVELGTDSIAKTYGGYAAYKASIYHGAPLGSVSSFVFDVEDFECKMFPIDTHKAPWFWEEIYDADLEYGISRKRRPSIYHSYGLTRDEFVRLNLSSEYNSLHSSEETYAKIREFLQKRDYRGFEYEGGRHFSTNYKHRAFCVWDDEWLNRHREKTVRYE